MKPSKRLFLLILVTVVISSCQPQAGTGSVKSEVNPPTSVSASPAVSAESCASASGPGPALSDPNDAITGVDVVGPIDRSLGGGTVLSREFTIELLLYCNSSYGPLSMEPYFLSDVRGLAVYYRWRYEGTVENGPVYVFSGFAPELQGHKAQDSLRPGQMNPPGPNALGVHVPANTSLDFAQGTSWRYVYLLQGPSGQLSGAVLSFDLQPVGDELQPRNVAVTALSDTELESMKSKLPPVAQ